MVEGKERKGGDTGGGDMAGGGDNLAFQRERDEHIFARTDVRQHSSAASKANCES